jgi:3-isopropylmalate dehydrogenase
MVDKANVLETRLWRRVVKTVSESYPDVALEFYLLTMQLCKSSS